MEDKQVQKFVCVCVQMNKEKWHSVNGLPTID